MLNIPLMNSYGVHHTLMDIFALYTTPSVHE